MDADKKRDIVIVCSVVFIIGIIGFYFYDKRKNKPTVSDNTISTTIPVITSPLSVSATTGTKFTYSIAPAGIYYASGLPPWANFNVNTGVISGYPNDIVSTSYNVTISVTNSYGTDTKTLVISVTPIAPIDAFFSPTPVGGFGSLSFFSYDNIGLVPITLQEACSPFKSTNVVFAFGSVSKNVYIMTDMKTAFANGVKSDLSNVTVNPTVNYGNYYVIMDKLSNGKLIS